MAAKVALILFGLFIGVILGITGMSLIVVSPFFTEAKALGDISNLIVAVGVNTRITAHSRSSSNCAAHSR